MEDKPASDSRMLTRRALLWGIPAAAAAGGTAWWFLRGSNLPVHRCKVVNEFPHDEKAFTQGLLVHEGFFYESTGLRGESSLRKVEIETGKVVQQHNLDDELFAEGLAVWNDKLIQLTYNARKAIYYELESFKELDRKAYVGEGWGLTGNAKQLIMSNGSAKLSFRDPDSFDESGNIKVLDDHGRVVRQLNELEFIDGEIWANIWGKDRAARIDPDSGKVTSWVDLSGLRPDGASEEGVTNGIAWDPSSNRLFVTGKLWPKVFEIEID